MALLSGSLTNLRDARRSLGESPATGAERLIVLPTQLYPAFTDPALDPGRRTHHERVIRHIFGHHRARADESVLANRDTTDNRAVGAQGCSFPTRVGLSSSIRGISLRGLNTFVKTIDGPQKTKSSSVTPS